MREIELEKSRNSIKKGPEQNRQFQNASKPKKGNKWQSQVLTNRKDEMIGGPPTYFRGFIDSRLSLENSWKRESERIGRGGKGCQALRASSTLRECYFLRLRRNVSLKSKNKISVYKFHFQRSVVLFVIKQQHRTGRFEKTRSLTTDITEKLKRLFHLQVVISNL